MRWGDERAAEVFGLLHGASHLERNTKGLFQHGGFDYLKCALEAAFFDANQSFANRC